MIPIIEYSLFQRFSLDEAANKRPRGVLPMMAYRGRLCPKGVSFSRKMVYEKGKGLDPGAEPPRKTFVEYPRPREKDREKWLTTQGLSEKFDGATRIPKH